MESQIHWIVLECVYFWLWKERLKKLILERRVCHLFFYLDGKPVSAMVQNYNLRKKNLLFSLSVFSCFPRCPLFNLFSGINHVKLITPFTYQECNFSSDQPISSFHLTNLPLTIETTLYKVWQRFAFLLFLWSPSCMPDLQVLVSVTL